MVADEPRSSHGVGRQPAVQRAGHRHGRTRQRLCSNLEPRRGRRRDARKRAAAHGEEALGLHVAVVHYLMPQFLR